MELGRGQVACDGERKSKRRQAIHERKIEEREIEEGIGFERIERKEGERKIHR